MREPRDDDVPAIVAAAQDPDLARFIPGFPCPYDETHAREWIESRRRAREQRTFAYVIADARTDELLGAVGVRATEVGSIGYWVAPCARGRGVATRATTLLSRWALTDGGVERLELTTHPENIASQRVAEKCGFTREGVVRAAARYPDGSRRDSATFSLLPRDLDPL